MERFEIKAKSVQIKPDGSLTLEDLVVIITTHDSDSSEAGKVGKSPTEEQGSPDPACSFIVNLDDVLGCEWDSVAVHGQKWFGLKVPDPEDETLYWLDERRDVELEE